MLPDTLPFTLQGSLRYLQRVHTTTGRVVYGADVSTGNQLEEKFREQLPQGQEGMIGKGFDIRRVISPIMLGRGY